MNLTDLISKNREEFLATQSGNEKKQLEHKKKLHEHTEQHAKKQEKLNELQQITTTLIDQTTRLDAKLEKTKGNLQEEQLRQRTDLLDKIDQNDRFCMD